MTIQIESSELLDFVEYVDTFYNPVFGVYPIKGVTVKKITKAIKTYISTITEEGVWVGGDSVDRERVRDIILAQNPECEVAA
jgi:hypothetical protein